MRRRRLLAAALGGSAAMLTDIRGVPQTVPQGPLPASPFTATTVTDLARALAAQPHRNRSTPLPREFQRLDYDSYRRVNFDRNQAIGWTCSR
jgi:glucan biosynthesis protein